MGFVNIQTHMFSTSMLTNYNYIKKNTFIRINKIKMCTLQSHIYISTTEWDAPY